MAGELDALRADYEHRKQELKNGSVKLSTGKTLDFYFYAFRTVAQEAEIEKTLREHDQSESEALLTAFMVSALDEDGKRLFKTAERAELRKVMAQSVLIDAVIQMGGVREDADPKD